MRSFSSMGAITLLALAGCAPQGGAQVISGKAALASFPLTPSKAVVVDTAGKTVAEAPLAADGAFKLDVPAGKGLAIQFATAQGKPALVFPRKSGTIDARFDVKSASTPFDLGSVRYVGDPKSSQYSYQTQALEAGEPAEGDGDGECTDGLDAAGAVCVDDDDEEGESCESDDGVDCENGIDPATGAECDGGPAANPDDGDEDGDSDGETDDDATDTGDGDGETDDDGVAGDDGADTGDGDGETADDAPSEAAVADHNLPASIGCDDGEADDGDGDGETDDDSTGNVAG